MECYKNLASQYNSFYEVYSQVKVEFIKKHVPLTQDDQVIDIGGGTAQVSLMLKEDLKLTKPVVCIDPSAEMLDIARRNGAITVQATAEDFLASEPPYPLKVVLMISCVHLFKDARSVITNLAKYMPSNGMCLVVSSDTCPWFTSAKAKKASAYHTTYDQSDKIQALAESENLKCRLESHTQIAELDKRLWYESIRNRCLVSLTNLTDRELEEMIEELEEEFADRDVIKVDVSLQGVIIAKPIRPA